MSGTCHKDELELDSKNGVDRFPVKLEDSAEFVTLIDISRISRTIVKCHSRECKINERNCRNVNTLDKSNNMCSHLRTFYLLQVLLNDQEEDALQPDHFDFRNTTRKQM